MSLSITPISEELPKEAVDANAAAFAQALKQAGFVLDTPIEASGEIVRVHVDGDSPQSVNGWYVFHGSYGWFGNWKNRNLKGSVTYQLILLILNIDAELKTIDEYANHNIMHPGGS